MPRYARCGAHEGSEEAIQVTVAVPVRYIFAKIFGLEGTTARRRAIAMRSGGGGFPILPMWVGYGTDYQYGVSQDLHATDGPDKWGRVAGNFGWLEPPNGRQDFIPLLQGYNVSREMMDQRELRRIPIIMVTSIRNSEYRGVFPQDEYLHIDRWLDKPFPPDKLVSEVQSALARHRQFVQQT